MEFHGRHHHHFNVGYHVVVIIVGVSCLLMADMSTATYSRWCSRKQVMYSNYGKTRGLCGPNLSGALSIACQNRGYNDAAEQNHKKFRVRQKQPLQPQQQPQDVVPLRWLSSSQIQVTHRKSCLPVERQQTSCLNGGECFAVDFLEGERLAGCSCPSNWMGDRCEQRYIDPSRYGSNAKRATSADRSPDSEDAIWVKQMDRRGAGPVHQRSSAFLDRSSALALLLHRRQGGQQGIICECCVNSCTLDELRTYCRQ